MYAPFSTQCLSVRRQHVSRPANRLQIARLFRVGFEFPPETRDLHIDRTLLRLTAVAAQILDQFRRDPTEIVQQLLGFSRKGRQDLKSVHLIPIVEEAIAFLRATIPANVAIRSDLPAVDDVVRADGTQIHQIMINLIENSIKFGRHLPEKRIGIAADALDGWVRLTVSDTGPGIPDAVKARVFDPFFSTKERGKGTGLGLSTVYGIVGRNRGVITVVSEPRIAQNAFWSSSSPIAGPMYDCPRRAKLP